MNSLDRLKKLGAFSQDEIVRAAGNPPVRSESFESVAICRGAVYNKGLISQGSVTDTAFLAYQGTDSSTIHSLSTAPTRYMSGREVAKAERPIKSKSSRAPLTFSGERTQHTRQDGNLRRDRDLGKVLASHGHSFVRKLGTALEAEISESVKDHLRTAGVETETFMRDVFAGWNVKGEECSSTVFGVGLSLFMTGCPSLLCAMVIKFIELKKVRKRLFYVDTYMIKVLGQVLEASHMNFISNIVGYVMGATPDIFEKKAREASTTETIPAELDASATAEGDIETFSPKSPASLRYYAARMTARLKHAAFDIVWLMLCRQVKLCVIVTGSATYSLMLSTFGDSEGTMVELMGFPTFVGAIHVEDIFPSRRSQSCRFPMFFRRQLLPTSNSTVFALRGQKIDQRNFVQRVQIFDFQLHRIWRPGSELIQDY